MSASTYKVSNHLPHNISEPSRVAKLSVRFYKDLKMSVRLTNRRSPLFSSGSSGASVTGLSLFHDNSRAHLLDDLTVICGDLKFPLLCKAKDDIVSKCIDNDKPKSKRLTKKHESSVFASMKKLFICHSTASATSSVDEKRHLTRPSRPLQRPESLDTGSWPRDEKTASYITSITSSSSLSSCPMYEQTLDFARLQPPALICQRRARGPLRIDTGLALSYPSNAESRCARFAYGFFPSSPEIDMTDSPITPVGTAGFEFSADDLVLLSNARRANAFEVKRLKNGNWI
ncbi:hypothetical protein QFC21_001667 [Naganishia friedmannii]|uniref:Uncharacterized protein n=1 Tax=Naganishia friedmannii TaxID=89922 RepID=A0ACC2W244_9TREE|nr:hypothetical protein QFC21_001667 [Naganishia friedmannii]